MTGGIGIFSKKSLILALTCSLVQLSPIMAQQSAFKKFNQQLRPLKWWAITHPFTVKKALSISEAAEKKALQMIADPDLDGDYAGGQIDAFRHAYWMAKLTHAIGERKALSLGRAHERANYIQFKRKMLEEKYLPCNKSKQMDLKNNQIGANIGIAYGSSPDERIVSIVKQAVLNGDLWILAKNNAGKFIDCNANPIPDQQWKGLWHNPKCVVKSNTPKPKAKPTTKKITNH